MTLWKTRLGTPNENCPSPLLTPPFYTVHSLCARLKYFTPWELFFSFGISSLFLRVWKSLFFRCNNILSSCICVNENLKIIYLFSIFYLPVIPQATPLPPWPPGRSTGVPATSPRTAGSGSSGTRSAATTPLSGSTPGKRMELIWLTELQAESQTGAMESPKSLQRGLDNSQLVSST